MTVYLNQTWLVPCPRCKAGVGSKCTALSNSRKKKGEEVMSHPERWEAAKPAVTQSAAGDAEKESK